MCQPFQPPPSIEICRIYHYIAVLLPEHCFLLAKKLQIICWPKTFTLTRILYRSRFQMPKFWRIKNIRSSPGTFRCTPFVKSSLQSHRPPMCPGIFSPFCKERNKNIWNALLLYLAIHLFILCVLKCAKRPAFLPGTFSIAWFARLLTLPSTWPFLRSGTPLRWGHP